MAGKKSQKLSDNNKRKWEYYKKLNPEWTEEQCQEAAKNFRKSCTYTNIEYYKRFYPELSDEEQERMRQERLYDMRKNNQTKIEYYIEHYPNATDKERYNMWHDFNQSRSAQSIKYYERKYPDATPEEREKMRREYIHNYWEKMPDYSGQNNPNSKKNTTEYERRSRSPRCIEFYQRKYPKATPDEQQKMLNKYFKENKLRIKNMIKDTNIEYYLNQGMSEDEARLALKNRQSTFSLDKCIKKYGEEEGKRIFNERQKNWVKKLQKSFETKGDSRSVQSIFAEDMIRAICEYLFIPIPKREKYMSDGKNNFAFDFTLGKKIIEFQGDYWHCNPAKYSADYVHKTYGITAQEVWDKDKIKLECAHKNGYEVLYIWELDYRKDREGQIKKCIEFLNV